MGEISRKSQRPGMGEEGAIQVTLAEMPNSGDMETEEAYRQAETNGVIRIQTHLQNF